MVSLMKRDGPRQELLTQTPIRSAWPRHADVDGGQIGVKESAQVFADLGLATTYFPAFATWLRPSGRIFNKTVDGGGRWAFGTGHE